MWLINDYKNEIEEYFCYEKVSDISVKFEKIINNSNLNNSLKCKYKKRFYKSNNNSDNQNTTFNLLNDNFNNKIKRVKYNNSNYKKKDLAKYKHIYNE